MSKNNLTRVIIVIAISLVVLIGGFSVYSATRPSNQNTTKENENKEKIAITTSVYPLYTIAKGVFGDTAEVRNAIPKDADSHDFEPSPRDIVDIQKAEMFVFLGEGLDPWAKNASNDIAGKSLNLSTKITLEKSSEKDEKHGEEEKKEDKHADEGGLDPHIWLDPLIVKEIANQMAEKSIDLKPSLKARVEENKIKFNNQLDTLDADFKTLFAKCENKDVIVSHDAFSYFSRRYDLDMIPISGLDPNVEPGSGTIAEIIEKMKEKNLTTIYLEPNLPRQFAETISSETKAEILTLDTLETLNPEANSEDYLQLMRKNMDSLKQGQKCN